MKNPKLHVILPTLGSAGDVHPVIGLSLKLQERGHRATIVTNPFFQEQIESLGIGFLPVGTIEEARALMAHPDLWHANRGFYLIADRVITPSLEPIYEAIAANAGPNTVVAASPISLGARIAYDKLGVPFASVCLQPSVIRSLVDGGKMGQIRLSPTHPMWFKRALLNLIDWAIIDRKLRGPLNQFRAKLGLKPIDHVFREWMHSPQLVIGFFPEWFAPPQPDWPRNTHCVGFPLWDAAGHAPVPDDAEKFLNEGEPPVIFTPGSAAATRHAFFEESVVAARDLGIRAMMVTNFAEQLPADLPANVRAFGYLPFSEVLPRAALLVHHGGIGTTAQTFKAGIPHIVVPNGHDQFDNAWRVERLRLGVEIRATKYKARRVAEAINGLLSDNDLKRRCRDYASRIDSERSITAACELIEGIGYSQESAAGN